MSVDDVHRAKQLYQFVFSFMHERTNVSGAATTHIIYWQLIRLLFSKKCFLSLSKVKNAQMPERCLPADFLNQNTFDLQYKRGSGAF